MSNFSKTLEILSEAKARKITPEMKQNITNIQAIQHRKGNKIS
jgi:hypothetical protein